MWPVYEDDITDLDYLCKNKVDRCIRYEWSSLCGIVPTADETKDPLVTDIHLAYRDWETDRKSVV